jgi:hypothetical protein
MTLSKRSLSFWAKLPMAPPDKILGKDTVFLNLVEVNNIFVLLRFNRSFQSR